jgi:prevent-host-death family protein
MAVTIVGVRQLKAQLSEYLKRVERGEQVTVAHRGRPVAMLVPATTVGPTGWIRDLLAEGRAEWSGGKPRGLKVESRPKGRGKPASRMVIEDRR